MKKVLRNILLVVCICVFLFSGYQLFSIYSKYRKVDEDNNKLVQEVITKVETEDEEKEEPFVVDFQKLKEINPDVVGWMSVPGTPISNVVVKAEDNDYYLHRNYNGEYSFAGTLFLDYMNTPEWQDFNTVVYGHNMKNDSMFGTLNKYKSYDYYTQHPYIEIYVGDDMYRYEVVCARDIDLSGTYSYVINMETSEGYVPLTEEAKQTLINEWENTRYYNTGVPMTTEDKYITLSTCVDTLNDNYRFGVTAKLIEVLKVR